MPRSRLFRTLVLVGLALTPALVAAQGTQTHVVKKGDTLWDLARQYLGDPFKWPEIYRRNTETVKDPNLIYPDQVLLISGDVPVTAAAPAEPAGAAMPAQPMMPSDSAAAAAATAAGAAPVAGAQATAGAGASQAGAPEMKPMTIFNPERFKVVEKERQSIMLAKPQTTVRTGEFARAPFLWEATGIPGVGRVGAAVVSDAFSTGRLDRPIQMFERVYVDVPASAMGAKDERFMSFRYGPTIEGEGRVIVPTGVFKILTAAVNGRAEAMLLTQYEKVIAGQGLTPLETLSIPAGVTPTRVEFGLRTTMIWLYDEPVIPTTGQHVILAAGAPEGLVPGDQITLQRDLGMDEKGVPLPPDDVAVLRVTRVTAWGASAIMIGQTDGGVKNGMPGRVTAKMP